MIKKLVVTIVVLVAIVGIAFAAYSNTNTKNSVNTTNSTSSDKVSVSVKNTTSNTVKTESNISPAKAQSIAATYIEVSGAKAGTPKLVNQDGTLIYIVPIIDTSNKTVGEIDIDAKTGKNVGGAGGAP
jgi:uncharacterized membrane protein YkoI